VGRLTPDFLDWQFPNLFQVLGGYLHQDFDLDSESPDDALRNAAEGQGREQISGAIREIDHLLASPMRDGQLMTLVERMTAGYSPALEGWAARDWLRHARELLAGGVAA
jgi:CdiI immunity protein